MRFIVRFSAVFLFALQAVLLGPCTSHAETPSPDAANAKAQSEVSAGLREKIGQMILVGFLGNTPGHGGFERVRAQMQAGEIGGVLYLGRNLKNRNTVRRMNTGLMAAAPGHLPPLIAVDQEGGVVQRLKRHHGFPQTVSAKRMARQVSPAGAARAYGALAEGLADWGFTLNLGPVVDVDVYPRNPIIGRLGRSYSADPKRVAEYGSAFVEAHRQLGVLTTLKHFPGHGSSRRDSHKGVVNVSRTWTEKELEPFRQMISEGRVDLIMTAHVINRVPPIESGDAPVSLSRQALTDVLRGDLGFAGVIISDDLQMDAIRRNFSLEEAVVRAVNAGTDILLFANDKRPDPAIPGKVADILVRAAAEDAALALRIDAAYGRILALKRRLLPEAYPAMLSKGTLAQWLAATVPDPERCSLPPAQ
ncbi:glycoside hydrolase family 3 protein [Roseibium sp. M-1]